MMNADLYCPKCRHARLRPSSPDSASPAPRPKALSCPKCGGFWLHPEELPDLISESTPVMGDPPSTESPSTEPPSAEPNEMDLKGGLCPEGHGILIRAHLDVEPPFYLDRCAHCGGVWFDRGEWQCMASLHLLRTLPNLWSEHWQNRQHDAKRHEAYRAWIRETLGEGLVEELLSLAKKLHGHEHREAALAFLRNESKAVD